MEFTQQEVQMLFDLAILASILYAGRRFRSYADEKGKNQATKEDVGKIAKEIEKVRIEYTKDIELLRSDLRREQ